MRLSTSSEACKMQMIGSESFPYRETLVTRLALTAGLKRRPLYFVKETIGFPPRRRTDGNP